AGTPCTGQHLPACQTLEHRRRASWFPCLVLWLHGGGWGMVRDVAVAHLERRGKRLPLLPDHSGGTDFRQPARRRVGLSLGWMHCASSHCLSPGVSHMRIGAMIGPLGGKSSLRQCGPTIGGYFASNCFWRKASGCG